MAGLDTMNAMLITYPIIERARERLGRRRAAAAAEPASAGGR